MARSMLERVLAVPKLLGTALVVALIIALVVVFFPGPDKRYVTAYFDRTVSLYEGSDVKILGVAVGKVEEVDPQGTRVRVRMWVDENVEVPADANAVIVSPAIVGDRFVQLTPAYTGGPRMDDGAVIGPEKTATPLELDEVYQALSDLAEGLGPRGANREGSLSRLLTVTARNFDGQGEALNQSFRDMGRLTGTLDNNKEELFASLEQLARFTAVLKASDPDIRAFNRDLAQLSQFLAGERGDLDAAMRTLAVALREVTTFVRENRDLIGEDVRDLARISQVLVDQQDALREILDVAPLALNNLALAYNPLTGTLDNRVNPSANEHQLQADPSIFLCSLLDTADPTGEACPAVKEYVSGLQQLQRTEAFRSRSVEATVVEVEHVDPSLAGVAAEAGR